ncbi:MAG: lipopolysaccharide biosynthesis protein, partial [Paracoccaceae bacterium]|nr:lipopolysaccharide biosynthesis protein [Paracoccaceae bacterium]
FLAVFVLGTAISLSVALLLPPVYEAEATLLVESAQIPQELAAPTVTTGASEELQIIEQRLMTRTNLLSVARQFSVFPNIGVMSADDIINSMKQKTTIQRSSGRDRATLMTISFASTNAQTSAAVVNEFITLILQGNTEIRTGRAGETLDFFQTEVDRLGKDLETQSARILEFKNQHADALPDTLQYRLTQQSSLQERLASVEREVFGLNEQQRRLIELHESQPEQVQQRPLTDDERQLERLREDLRTALAIYSAENPKVKLLQAQVAQQEQRVKSQAGLMPPLQNQSANVLDLQLADIDARLELLQRQKMAIEVELEKLLDSIGRTPANAIALDALQRDYDNVQKQYNQAVDRLSAAATGERIELLSKGQRIAILDPAVPPQEPTKPNRVLISLGGTIFSFASGMGLVILIEFLNSAIRRPTDIVRQLGITPLGTIPYVRTPVEMIFRRAVFAVVFAFFILGIPTLFYLIDTYYLPLDLIMDQIAGKFGVRL